MEPEILAEELRLFKAGKVDIFKMAARLKTYRELLLMLYIHEVRNKRLERIENLSKEMKESIWAETKKDSAGLGKKECIELSKIVYLISSKI